MTQQYGSLREKIAAESAARRERYAQYPAIVAEADAAGRKAAEAVNPTPMIVEQRENMLDDSSPVTKQWIVEGGVCGFGWVTVKPANCSFAIWAKKYDTARRWGKDYYGGISVSSPLMTQSMARNAAWARGFAQVLQSHGIKAQTHSRID